MLKGQEWYMFLGLTTFGYLRWTQMYIRWIACKPCILLTDFAQCNKKRTFAINLSRIADTTPPTFLDCPVTHPVIFIAPGQTHALVNWTVPTATDTTGVQPAVAAAESNVAPPGSQLEQGIHRFEYIAEDSAGNIGKCTFYRLIQGNFH